jgi:hypothetical protein
MFSPRAGKVCPLADIAFQFSAKQVSDLLVEIRPPKDILGRPLLAYPPPRGWRWPRGTERKNETLYFVHDQWRMGFRHRAGDYCSVAVRYRHSVNLFALQLNKPWFEQAWFEFTRTFRSIFVLEYCCKFRIISIRLRGVLQTNETCPARDSQSCVRKSGLRRTEARECSTANAQYERGRSS